MISDNGFNLRLIFLPLGYCNYHCRFCHLEGLSSDQGKLRGQDFDPEQIKELIGWLRPIGLDGVTMTGGEPLLALNNVLNIAEKLPPLPLTLATNGTRLWSLIERLDRFNGRSLSINLNMPTFESRLFQKLTGQKKFSPSQAIEAATALVRLGVEVNLNCVVCPGYNDAPQMLRDFVQCVDKLGFNSSRFLVQNEASKRAVLNALQLWFGPSFSWKLRRGGRLLTLLRKEFCSVEVVICHREANSEKKTIQDAEADLYLSARNSVKLGLSGKEFFFADWTEFQSILTRNLGLVLNDSANRTGITLEARVS